MAIKTGPADERKLNWHQNLYFWEVFKGMLFTLKHMFRPPVTMEYPEKKWIPPPEFRGRPVLVEENGKERCVACGLCARACPPLAISMQADELPNDPKERYPLVFEIDMLRCIYCGYCEEVCPEEAIVMSNEYDFTFRSRDDAKYSKDRLLVSKDKLQERLDFLRRARNPAFGAIYDFHRKNNIHSLRDMDIQSGKPLHHS